MIKWTAVMLVIGFLLDLLIGDPRWPVSSGKNHWKQYHFF